MSVKIALLGNPNCGKTTAFNALTGSNQYVGNWPGVTVEHKEGKYSKNKDVIITDLPGIYSLSPYTLEEVVSRDYLVNEKPEAILNVVDASNIERNLYLTTQGIELGIPVVLALNMIDIVQKRGDKINIKKLGDMLGCAVFETSALKEKGLDEAVAEAVKLAQSGKKQETKIRLADDIEEAVAEIEGLLPSEVDEQQRRWFAIKLLERDSKVLERMNLSNDARSNIEAITAGLEKSYDNDIESIVANSRYDFIVDVVQSCVKKAPQKMSASDRVDQIVTHRILGLPIFAVVMFLVYFISVSWLGTIVTDWTNDTLFGEWIQPGVQSWLESVGANEYVIDLIVNGIIGGVGSVLGFVPQMFILFLLLSILEDIGYMARIAFIMDRVFRSFGLSGKSFIPLLISSGCGVPGIMSSKTIENDNDRRLTIMTATYVPCGAKIPVISLIAGVMAGENGWWVAPATYFIGVVVVLLSAIILKKFKPFHGTAAPFVMELPAYHIPSPRTILIHVWEKLWGYIKKVGTVLFAACVVMWFLSSYGFGPDGFGLVDQEYSLIAALGMALAWLFVPLGFGNWAAVASTLSGFVAKESIVSTMTILSSGAAEISEEAEAGEDPEAWGMIGNALFGIEDGTGAIIGISAVAAFSFLIFNMLNSPCLAAISTMNKEMQSAKWFWGAILFQNVNAYLLTLMIYQIGSLLIGGVFSFWTVIAFVVLACYIFLIVRPDPYKNLNLEAKRSVA